MKSTDEVVTENLGPAVVPRGQRRVFLIALAFVAVLLVGFYVSSGRRRHAPAARRRTPGVRSPGRRRVVAVDSAGLGDVRGFTLRASGGGFRFAFVLGALENATEFSPSHLAEHQASSQPVRVWFRTADGIHTVYRLEDAPAAPPS